MIDRAYIIELRTELSRYVEEYEDRMGVVRSAEPRDRFLEQQMDRLRAELDGYHKTNPELFSIEYK